jgi:protein-S-isoprenylcysteine O-methyltransferase Ste14
MKITGVAPQIAVPTMLYLIATAIVHILTRPLFIITEAHYKTLVFIAIIMLAVGIVIVFSVARKLLSNFRKGTLMTNGLFKVFRNPMYAGYLLFITPAIALLFNSWLMLSAVIINYILFRVFIKKEYDYLHDSFGADYKNYLKQVWFRFL